jgi:hypothetical protein
MGAALPVIGLALGAVGTGLSYFSQMNAAKSAETFSMLNAQAGVQAAQQQGAIASLQAQLQATQAETAERAANDTADAARAAAESDAAVAQENIRRIRDEFTRALAEATAQAGGSGAVITTGSPLDYLVTAADQEAQEERTATWVMGTARQRAYREASAIELGGKVQGMNASLFQLESLSAIQQGRTGAAQARLGGLAGRAQAGGMRSAAFGGLIGGAASTVNAFAATPYYRRRY